jgi:hypothetical protein
MKNLFHLLLFILLSSCEKGIDFKLNQVEDKLVVEGVIESHEFPTVVLTRSFNYFSRISPQQLTNAFVRQADVWISDGVKTHKLIEYQVPVDTMSFYYYSVNPNDPYTLFKGEEGGKYNLKIVVDGKEYTASTTIPNLTKTVDSLWWVQAPVVNDTTKVVLKGKFTDPPQFGNYIRYYTKVDQQPFYPGENSVFDDQVVNGTTYIANIDRGVDRNSPQKGDQYVFFNRGDTVTLKYSNIDKATYDFWRTMEFNYGSTGNPFASPNKVLGNISNGALGYFGGYANQFKTIIIPR